MEEVDFAVVVMKVEDEEEMVVEVNLEVVGVAN